MKKSRIIEIFKFLSTIKLNKVTDKEVRKAIISNHMQMHNIVKQYDGDVKELQEKLFEDKKEELQKLSELREEYKTADDARKKQIEKIIIKDYKDVITLEVEFNNEIITLLNVDVELNLTKVSQEKFVECCVDADIDITTGDLIFLTDLFV